MINLFSFFSGIGFLDLGFENAGYNIQFVNEIHKPFLDGYRFAREKIGPLNSNCKFYEGSIETLTNNSKLLEQLVSKNKKSGDVFGFIGGPPCPDFSIAGKNRGRYGENGKLSKSYVEIICKYQPTFFFFENVKGLWRTLKHRAFYEELKTQLANSGYVLSECLINALDYGVPQDRERIILIGIRKQNLIDLGKKIEGTNIKYFDFPWIEGQNYIANEVINLDWPTVNHFQADSKLNMPTDIPSELTVEHWFKKNDVENHPNSKHHFIPRAGLAKFEIIDEGDDSKKSYKRLHRWRYSPTAAYGNNEVHLHPYKVRRISVAEALAIQSLPKEFQLPEEMSLTNMFKAIGNGVPYIVALRIAKKLKEFLGK